MSFYKAYLKGMVVSGLLLASVSARAFIIPVASTYEITMPDLQLMIESELTRWKEEALKYREMAYTDLLGRVGGGGLDDGGIMDQMKTSLKDNINLMRQTQLQLGQVTNLGAYTEATKKQIEDAYLISPEEAINLSTDQKEKIIENQQEALNDWAGTGLSMSAAVLEAAKQNAEESDPEKRADQLSKAQDLNSMRELMLRMDRNIYARQLQLAGMEATLAGIQAMQLMQSLSGMNPSATESGQSAEDTVASLRGMADSLKEQRDELKSGLNGWKDGVNSWKSGVNDAKSKITDVKNSVKGLSDDAKGGVRKIGQTWTDNTQKNLQNSLDRIQDSAERRLTDMLLSGKTADQEGTHE